MLTKLVAAVILVVLLFLLLRLLNALPEYHNLIALVAVFAGIGSGCACSKAKS